MVLSRPISRQPMDSKIGAPAAAPLDLDLDSLQDAIPVEQRTKTIKDSHAAA
jgi:hypothetical protein